MENQKPKEKIVSVDTEKIESDYESINKLSRYTDVLKKKEFLYVKFSEEEELYSEIELRSRSFYRICEMNTLLPEETAIFTLVITEEDEDTVSAQKSLKNNNKNKIEEENNQSEKKRGDVHISRASAIRSNDPNEVSEEEEEPKEKVNEEENPNNIYVKDTKLRSKPNNDVTKKADKENDKMLKVRVKKTIRIVENLKGNIVSELRGRGNFMAKDPESFQKIWINMYKYLPVFAPVIFAGLLVYMISHFYILTVPEILSYFNSFIILLCSYLGNSKLSSKIISDFKRENIMLSTIITLGLYTILACKIPLLSGFAFPFLTVLFAKILIFYIFVILYCSALILLNVKMMDFYKRYYLEIEEGSLLQDIV